MTDHNWVSDDDVNSCADCGCYRGSKASQRSCPAHPEAAGLLLVPEALRFINEDIGQLLTEATGWAVMVAPSAVLDNVKFFSTDNGIKVVRLSADDGIDKLLGELK